MWLSFSPVTAGQIYELTPTSTSGSLCYDVNCWIGPGLLLKVTGLKVYKDCYDSASYVIDCLWKRLFHELNILKL